MAEYPKFAPYRGAAKPFNLTGPEGDPGFTGVARYTATFALPPDCREPVGLDLGIVGQTASAALNGTELGLRICPPYRYDAAGIFRPGENTLVVEVRNTLVHEVKDSFSSFLQIPPTGLMGPVCLLYQ
jgi:hypothetical protein